MKITTANLNITLILTLSLTTFKFLGRWRFGFRNKSPHGCPIVKSTKEILLTNTKSKMTVPRKFNNVSM